jgi:replicative DNA helicase
MKTNLPVAIDAERSILGAILLDNGLLFDVAPILKPEDFSLDSHRILYVKMQQLLDAGKPIETLSLVEELGKKGEIAKVGGVGYLTDLTTGIIRGSSVEHYVNIVQEKSQRRQVIHVCNAGSARAADSGEPIQVCFSRVEDSLLAIQAHCGKARADSAKEIVPAVLDEIAALRHSAEDVIGFTTGVPSLDNTTTGIRPDEYWVVGALPSRGKTLLGIQIAAANAKRGIPVLFFSYEMTKRQLMRRVLAGETKVPAARIRDPRYMSNAEWQELTEKGAEISKWPLYVDDPEELTARELVARARLHIRRFGVRLIVVDYLQLIEAPGKELRERVSAASNALRRIPKSEGVPVVALSQLSRPRDRNENGQPSMVDLKESGSIEAHAHVVLLLYRPKNEQGEWTGEDEIIIAKQREGLVGWEPVVVDSKRLRFVERERQ